MCWLAEKLSASQETLCTSNLFKGKEVRLRMCLIKQTSQTKTYGGLTYIYTYTYIQSFPTLTPESGEWSNLHPVRPYR